jgi:hypothetical protein
MIAKSINGPLLEEFAFLGALDHCYEYLVPKSRHICTDITEGVINMILNLWYRDNYSNTYL